MFFHLIFFFDYLLKEKIKAFEEKNPDIKVRETLSIFKFIILNTMFIAKTNYGIDDIKINQEYMQKLNNLIMEDFNAIFNKNKSEYKNNLIFINAKKEFEFILKHNNISHEFFNDYATLTK